MIVMFMKHQRSTQKRLDKYVAPKLFLPNYVAKYKTPNSNIDHLSTKHQIETKHQIDMDKTCQCHHNKQEHVNRNNQEPE